MRIKTVTILTIFILCGISTLNAQIPQLINYQGYLTDAGGTPAVGKYSVLFSIYNSAEGGSALWSETRIVTASEGYFSVLLGENTALPLDIFNGSEKYLALIVGSDSEMSPRKRLVSVGYAFRSYDADRLGGFEAHDFVKVGEDAVIAENMLQSDAVIADKILPDIISSIDGVVNDAGDVDLIAGSNVSITPDDVSNTITISATPGGGGGDITSVIAGDGLAGGGDVGDVRLDIEASKGILVNENSVQVDFDFLAGQYVNEEQENSISSDMVVPNIVSSIDGVINDGGDVDLIEGTNITITPDDAANTITISAVGGGGDNFGDHTATQNIQLNGNWISNDGDISEGLSINNDGVAVFSNGIMTGSPELIPLGPSITSTEHVLADGQIVASGVANYFGSIGGYSAGALGQSLNTDRFGCLGYTNYGVYGGHSTISSLYGYLGGTYGAYGQSSSSLHGYLGGTFGAYGQNGSTKYGYLGGSNYGAYGQYNSTHYGYLGGSKYGVYGQSSSSIYGRLGNLMGGVYGRGGNWGVRGYQDGSHYGYLGSSSYGVYSQGDCHVNGTLTKTAGSFRIDHPLDPENKYLQHSFVESPDMMNVYNGNVMLDNRGEAVVELPEWFEALNKEFRYQLTAIGAPGPNLYIADKITGNQFRIAGGEAGMEVSWQVTGIRKDAFAEANRIQVELQKEGIERGKYQHPEVYGLSIEMRTDYDDIMIDESEHQIILEQNRQIQRENENNLIEQERNREEQERNRQEHEEMFKELDSEKKVQQSKN